MTAWRIGLRLLARDWRSGDSRVLAAALVLTVAAVTAVGFFAERVEQAMYRQGSELIAADLVLDGSAPIPAIQAQKARALGLAVAHTLEFPSMVMHGETPRLVQVKAVEATYPLRGQLRTRAAPEAPAQAAAGIPERGEAWVEARLLPLLGLELGASVRLGEAEFRITRLLDYEPDRDGSLFRLSPRVLIHRDDIPTTGLVTPASRVRYRLLVAGDPPALTRYRRTLAEAPPANIRQIDAREARPAFSTAVERASRFLHLSTLVTLLVAGAAIALASRHLVERQIDAVAVMRCLGAHRHFLTRVFVLRLLIFGLGASLLGGLLGWLVQPLLTALLADWFALALPAASLKPLAVGLVTGLVSLLGFALPPLLQLTRVPPLHALRRDLGAPRASVAVAVGAALAALALLILWQAGDFVLASKLLVGVGAALAALIASVLVLVRAAARLGDRVRGIWRLGLAALTRRRAGAVLQIAGFGLGILALLLLAVVRVDLLGSWQASLPPDAPNRFLINIQPGETETLHAFLEKREISGFDLFPMIRGRLLEVNGTRLHPEDYDESRAQRLAAREFNLSWADRIAPDNRIVAGRWWEDPQAPPQFSVEQGLAKTLGLNLGDRLGFWIDGRLVEAPITSLREVRWDSFRVNFFVLAPRSLLEGEAATYITSFHLPREREALVPELIRAFPGLTLFDVEALLGQVRRILDRSSLAVESLFLFTLGAGILVLYAGIQASLEERRAEHGVLRTLGVGRRRLLAALAVEFAAAGLLAGGLAAGFAQFTGWLLAEEVFGFSFHFNPRLWLLGVLGSTLLVSAAGTLATYPLLVRPPLESLRRA